MTTYEHYTTDGYTTARVSVDDYGQGLAPLALLRLTQDNRRIALELTPAICDHLINWLADVSTILEEHEEKVMAAV